MPLPLALAVPAVAAALAYFNARTALWSDLHLSRAALTGAARLVMRAATDQLNQFYVLERLARSAHSKDRPFLIFGSRTHTYAEAYETVLRYGHWLRVAQAVRPGDVVALDVGNSDVFVFLWFGLWSIGAKPAFINYNLKGPALAHCIRAARTRLVIVDAEFAENIDQEVRTSLMSRKADPGSSDGGDADAGRGDAENADPEDGREIRFVTLGQDVLAEAAATAPFRYPDPDRTEAAGSKSGWASMAILIYTSGTTGLPKAAIVSWGKVIVLSVFTSCWIGRTRSDVLYTPMPLYHTSAAVMGVLSSLEAGAAVAIGRRFSTKTFWPDVRASNASVIQYVGETCRYLLAAPAEIDPATGADLDRQNRVRIAIGNGLRPDVWNRFRHRFGIETIAEMYSATEAMLATFNLSSNDFSAGAVGRSGALYALVMHFSVAIVEVDLEKDAPVRDPATGRCRRVATGQPGELIFGIPFSGRGRPSVFQGYYGDDSATSRKVLRDVFAKGDAWFRTGDVMRLDHDGLLFFCDRIGDTFRWKGENVSTAEVSAVMGAYPAVGEVNVYGVEVPHHDGRIGCAAMVLRDGAAEEEALGGLAGLVNTGLPPYARPAFLRIMTDLGGQTTGTNKQQKHVLRGEGVQPGRQLAAGGGRMFWLRGERYVPFGEKEWGELQGGRVRL